jgi:[glutamine synthetase] adenylyltransferase / [glutamine synthetase]-adenylyl-L-tyrosine phosphorylase
MPNSPPDDNQARQTLDRAARLSRYARQLLDADAPSLSEVRVDKPFQRAEMHSFLAAPIPDEAALKRRLRELRRAVMLRLIARDLDRRCELAEVMTTATALAEETLRCAIDHCSRQLTVDFGRPIGATSGQVQHLHVVAMGKMGGEELNVSSDIDLIFLYPEAGETDGARHIANDEFFTRLARKLIAALSEITSQGFVFRVDTRLRPYGDGGPLTVNFDMLENYLVSQGREWERYAWVKGRLICGERIAELQAIVDPFVYRRHLDFNAISSLRALHAQIRQEVSQSKSADNIKLGVGGIREIEFLVQVFQIMRGGNDKPLRAHGTLAALAVLEEKQLLAPATVAQLRSAYIFLRNLEHRLQYLDDQQTQTLPRDPDDRNLVAEMMGYANFALLAPDLTLHRDRVSAHFSAMFADYHEEVGAHPCLPLWEARLADAEAASRLAALGIVDPDRICLLLKSFRGGGYRRMSASGQSLLDQLLPRLLEAIGTLANPDAGFERTLSVIEAIGRRESYLALLSEYPSALGSLVRLAAASPWAASYLAQHPILLDELILPGTVTTPDWPMLKREWRTALEGDANNTERQMDLLRHFKQTQTLRLLMADLAGQLPLETLSDHLSDLASLLLEEVVRLAWAGTRQRHCDLPRFAIIGYGKLGGKELGYASDLDIIFLHQDTHPQAGENYARLSQRINTWLSSTTSAGVLYETDLRLRPNGVAGLLVSSIDAFKQYQLHDAWPWEHQALTRARFVAGDAAVGALFEDIRIEVLRQPRDKQVLRNAVLEMRGKMRAAHPNRGEAFDLKHDAGGIVDVEFIVQYLVLANAHQHVALTRNLGNLALLKIAAELSLIPVDLAARAQDAYRQYRRLQHALRLESEKFARVNRPVAKDHIAAVLQLWDHVFGRV